MGKEKDSQSFLKRIIINVPEAAPITGLGINAMGFATGKPELLIVGGALAGSYIVGREIQYRLEKRREKKVAQNKKS